MGEFEGFSAWCMEVIRGTVGMSDSQIRRLARVRDSTISRGSVTACVTSLCDSLCTLIGRGSAGMAQAQALCKLLCAEDCEYRKQSERKSFFSPGMLFGQDCIKHV